MFDSGDKYALRGYATRQEWQALHHESTGYVRAFTQVTVNPSNSRVLVASTANNTLWVLDNVGDDGSGGGCAVLELQVC